MAGALAVEFAGVTKDFGPLRALDGIDLRVHSGEVVALLGPNGAGKSTSVGLMLGLRRPTSGAVRVFGGDPEAAVRAGRVGAMLQTSGLPPGVRVREMVEFIRGLYPRPRPLAEVLQAAACETFADQRVERLSGGQQQRVRFAMAIAGDPELLFLDEPTTGFDVDTRRRFWQSMRTYAADGRTVLFATHYLEEADGAADRIVVMQHGRIVADGTAAAIKAGTGTRTVRFSWAGADRAVLQQLPGVTGVVVDGDQVRLATSDADATVRAAVLGGLPFVGLEVAGADLEEAFLALVNAEDGAEEAHAR